MDVNYALLFRITFFILIFYGNSDKLSVALFRAEEITMVWT